MGWTEYWPPLPVRKQLEEAEDQSKGVRREGEGEVERLQEQEKELELVERLDIRDPDLQGPGQGWPAH